MANYAYLRVSTHTQDVENQKLSVLDYCNSQGIAPIEFVEDTTSGRRSWRDREIGRLLDLRREPVLAAFAIGIAILIN